MKTSSEMFAIYKYTTNPRMIVRSTKYTDAKYVEVKDIIDQEGSLLETSILNLYQV
jgi:hypothetical protein